MTAVRRRQANARQVRRAAARRTRVRRPPRWLHPSPEARALTRELWDLLDRAQERVLALVPRLVVLLRRTQATQPRADEDVSIQSIGERIREAFPGAEGRRLARAAVRGTSDFNKAQFRKVVNTVLGVEPLIAEPWLPNSLRLATVEMRKLISSIPQQLERQTEGLLLETFRSGVRAEEIESQIEAMLRRDLRGRFDVAKSRAELIARDQISKLNGTLSRLRQASIGIGEYTWRTSNDERVRESHAEKEGQRFRWDDPPADTGHPGEDFQCRCYAEPVLEDLLGEGDGEDE